MSVPARLRGLSAAVGAALVLLVAPALAHATPVITSPTEGATINREDVTVAFHDSVNANSTFECGFDGADWEACATGVVYGPLENGEHYLFVAANGNHDDMAQLTFTVNAPPVSSDDTTAPETTITGDPAGGGTTRLRSVRFVFTANEPNVSFRCAKDGATTFTSCTSGHALTFSTQGAHSLAVRGTDRSGNVDATPAVRTFSVDSVEPVATLSSRKLDTRGAGYEWTFASNEAGSSFVCSLDNAPFTACAPPLITNTAPGRHGFDVRAVDPAGNTSNGKGSNWTTGPILAPTLTLGAPPAAIKTLRSKGLSVPVTTNGPSQVTGALFITAATAKKLKLGKKRIQIGSGTGQVNGTGKLVLKLKTKYKAKLRKVKRFAATISISATNAGGTTTKTRLVTLK